MFLKRILRYLLVAAAAMTVSLPAQSAMVGTAQLQAGSAALELAAVTDQRDWIREQLIVGGVAQAKAAERVAAMTDAQVQDVYQRIDSSPAGGTSALLVVIVVLVVLEVMGYTDFIKD
ncbi:MAG TPA: PA2779 family protein [Gammaproteobacteria bacterium]|nr:PA2779 family protein [Gammaproteobacteria bacterium]